MKVLDPQSALLTIAEVYQFLKEKPPRKGDKKIGSYPVVNLHNYNIIRSDLDNYTSINHAHIADYAPVDTFTNELIRRLKPFELTKAEVFSLINLGVGVTDANAEAMGDAEVEPNGDTVEEPTESDLAKSLFRLIVEESEQRFEGDAGEQKITEILAILRETRRMKAGESTTAVTNGHHEAATTTNGTS